MSVFKNEKNSSAYENAYNQYLKYLSVEEQYTLDNLIVVYSFTSFIRLFYANSEVILYTTQNIAQGLPFDFLGIDIIDQHLESVIKDGTTAKYSACATNQYNLYCSLDASNTVIQQMIDINPKYSDLSSIYVYALKADLPFTSWTSSLIKRGKRYSLS